MTCKKYKYLLAVTVLSLGLLAGCSDERQENKDAYRQLGIQYMQEGNYEDAILAFDNALKQSVGEIGEEEIDICYYKAAAQYAGGDTESAVATYTAVIEYDKKAADAYFQRGCLYLRIGETEAAKADFDHAVEYNGDEYELYISIYENLTACGLTEDGEAYLNQAFKIKGNSTENNIYRGRIYCFLGQYENALTELTKAAEAGSPEADLYIAQVYDAQGDTENAKIYYQAYADSGNTDSETLNALGEIALAKGEYAEALSCFHEALNQEKVSNKKELLQNLIIAYEYTGDFSAAWSVMVEYADAYPLDEKMQREYIFLENRQIREETVPEEAVVEGTEAVEDTETTSETGE